MVLAGDSASEFIRRIHGWINRSRKFLFGISKDRSNSGKENGTNDHQVDIAGRTLGGNGHRTINKSECYPIPQWL